MNKTRVPGEVNEVRRGGLLPLLRGDAASLGVFIGPGHVGPFGIVALMLLGTIPGVVGGVLLVVWAVVSLLVCLRGYLWLEERKRRETARALAFTEMLRLAYRVIELYSRPAEGTKAAEVFALYRQAQQALESGDPWRAEEITERGISLADELSAGKADAVSSTGVARSGPPHTGA
ncbi:MAG: hypothetical protein M3259_04795 [Actinomycetota bacterium]|nr:hypothetical protein [Actinomycetota bacterium]